MGKPMRIAYLTNSLSIHDFKFVSNITANGHQVFLFTFHDVNDPRLPEYYQYINSDVIEQIKKVPNLTIVRYFPWVYAGGNRWLKYFQFFLHALVGPLMVRRKFKEFRCDLIDAGFIQRDGFIAALSGIRQFLLTSWGSDVLLIPKTSAILRHITAYTIRRSAMVYSDSNVVRSEVMAIGGVPRDRTVVFPQLGVDVARFNPAAANCQFRRDMGYSAGDIVIICTRNFERKYNIIGLVDAVDELRRLTKTPFKVLLIGRGETHEQITQAVARLGLEGYIKIVGYVRNDLLPGYLASSDISVSPSLTDGTPLSLLEAMACGLPLVMTDIASYHDWVVEGENGFLVQIGDAKAMANRLRQLIEDVNLRRKMGVRNRQIAEERADIKKNYFRLEHVYRYICGLEPHPPEN